MNEKVFLLTLFDGDFFRPGEIKDESLKRFVLWPINFWFSYLNQIWLRILKSDL